MILEQVSVFVENKPGALSEITTSLADAGIDLKAFTVADKSEFGVLRFLSDEPKKALALLKHNGWIASITPVVAVKMADKPGSLAKVLKMFADAGVQVEYLYAFVAQEEERAYVVLRVEDTDGAIKLLEAAGIGGQ
jgi:hypothetical protein